MFLSFFMLLEAIQNASKCFQMLEPSQLPLALLAVFIDCPVLLDAPQVFAQVSADACGWFISVDECFLCFLYFASCSFGFQMLL